MSDDDWPGGFVSAKTLKDVEDREEETSVFNDHGVRYASGEGSFEEYMYMEDMPNHLENKC